ncbi:MAG: hypothetical protein GF344_05380 [Chitinivibrionales bacterium]|nr:hypothetical protein [Chitinivibrionales bacterium]
MSTETINCLSQLLWEEAEGIRRALGHIRLHEEDGDGLLTAAISGVEDALQLLMELCFIVEPLVVGGILSITWRVMHRAEWAITQLAFEHEHYRSLVPTVTTFKEHVLQAFYEAEKGEL